MSKEVGSLCLGCMTFKDKGESICTHCGFCEDTYSVPPHHLRPGTILNGKYLIGTVLGEGGFGITYIGWDQNLELKVAIKEYYPRGFVARDTASADTVTALAGEKTKFYKKNREKFIEEARRLAKFYTLPGIVAVKDFFQGNDTAYIVMEYVSGKTLKQSLEESDGRMSEAKVLEMMKPLMDSLSHIHESGIIHRDISPDNIMITREGNVKLLDFGAAREFLDDRGTQTVLLKPGYAPEEQYSSDGEYQGAWTDVYALCATMYRAIEGKTPPEAPKRLRQDTLTGFSVAVSPSTQSALLKGMAVLHQNRWQSVSELSRALYKNPVSRPSDKRTPKKLSEYLLKLPEISEQNKKRILIGIGSACAVFAVVLGVVFLRGLLPDEKAEVAAPYSAPVAESSNNDDVSQTLPSEQENATVSRTGPKAITIGDQLVDTTVTELDLTGKGIDDISAIKDLVNLKSLNLNDNNVKDISVLKELDHLEILHLNYNPIGDLSPLSQMTGLKELYIENINIGDIEFLKGLVNLRKLSLWTCQVSDISALRGLTGLEELSLGRNLIEDINALGELVNLKKLNITSNPVSDINVLAKLHNLQELSLFLPPPASGNNPSSILSPVLENLPALKLLSLNGCELGDIDALKNCVNLETLDISYNNIRDISVLKELPNLKELNLDSNPFDDLSVIKQMTGLTSLSLNYVSIGDPDFLTGLTNLNSLLLNSCSLNDLSVLTNMANLKELSLQSNEIRNIDDLSGLTKLTELSLRINPIESIDALANMTNLEYLTISHSPLSDISVLKDLHSLEAVAISFSQVTDISPLKDLIAIESLSLAGNGISDISPLEGLINLSSLELATNKIENLDPLRGLTGLTSLSFSGNRVSDISPIAGLIGLQSLSIGTNQISDIEPLKRLTDLYFLSLSRNQIDDFSVLKNFTKLLWLDVTATSFDDVELLKGFEDIMYLTLTDTPLTQQQIDELEQALPDCTIRL